MDTTFRVTFCLHIRVGNNIKMASTCSPKTLVTNYHTTQRHTTDFNLYIHHHTNINIIHTTYFLQTVWPPPFHNVNNCILSNVNPDSSKSCHMWTVGQSYAATFQNQCHCHNVQQQQHLQIPNLPTDYAPQHISSLIKSLVYQHIQFLLYSLSFNCHSTNFGHIFPVTCKVWTGWSVGCRNVKKCLLNADTLQIQSTNCL